MDLPRSEAPGAVPSAASLPGAGSQSELRKPGPARSTPLPLPHSLELCWELPRVRGTERVLSGGCSPSQDKASGPQVLGAWESGVHRCSPWAERRGWGGGRRLQKGLSLPFFIQLLLWDDKIYFLKAEGVVLVKPSQTCVGCVSPLCLLLPILAWIFQRG